MTIQDLEPRRLDPTGGKPWPLAIGILGIAASAGVPEGRAARVDLALHAYKLGYFLVDLVEVDPAQDDGARVWLEALAAQIEADAFLCAGGIDETWVAEMAERRRTVVRSVELCWEQLRSGNRL